MGWPLAMRIALTGLLVADYDAALGFYADALGFALISDNPGGGGRWDLIEPRP